LIAGDSAAAGVGVGTQGSALSGQLVRELTGRFRVDWRLEAKTGVTTPGAIRWLSKLEDARFDVMVTSLGVNDLTRGTGTRDWLHRQRELRELARDRLGVKLLVLSGLPPMGGFPLLPQPLRWYLGRRADEFSERLREQVADEPGARFLDLRFTSDATLMAEDGFHPGPRIYREWAKRAAGIILSDWRPIDGSAA
jgi:lysophospholipase L1-like esterase